MTYNYDCSGINQREFTQEWYDDYITRAMLLVDVQKGTCNLGAIIISVTKTGEARLEKWKDDTEVILLPEYISSISENAFCSCKSLKHIDMSRTHLKELAAGLFGRCKELEEVKLPNGLLKIQENSFRGTKLKFIEIPDSVERIKAGSFSSCCDLTDVYIGKGSQLSIIEQKAFMHSGLRHMDFPNTLVSIHANAFASCNLEDIKFGTALTNINKAAFMLCEHLKEVDVSESHLTTIAEHTFYGCENLEILNFGNRIQHLRLDALKGCKNLRRIKCTKDYAEDWIKKLYLMYDFKDLELEFID